MIISFAHTTPALLAGQKTVTRRDWSEKHAAKFKEGMICDAWNYSPRVVSKNPHKVAEIRITSIYRENTSAISALAYYFEGFQYLDREDIPCPLVKDHLATWCDFMDQWILDAVDLYVVEFQVVRFCDPMEIAK